MGATTFTTAAWGKTPSEAFRAAHEHATYESGHGGYTGTIAEKPGYRLFILPARCSIEKVLGLMDEMEYEGVGYHRERVQWLERCVRDAKPGTVRSTRAHLTAAKKELAKAIKAQERFEKKHGELLPLLRQIHSVYDQKWEDCVAFAVTTAADRKRFGGGYPIGAKKRGARQYVFAGWAST